MSGKQELVERLMKPIFVTLESPGTTTTDNVIAEGDYVVVQSHASGRTTKTGKSYNNIYCMVFKVIDSKIKEVTEYCDTELITAAFGH
jgi:ketosteroid isomerase-like protein